MRGNRPRSSLFLWDPLANHHGCGLRDRLLIERIPTGWLQSFLETTESRHCLCVFLLSGSRAKCLLERSFAHIWYADFYICCPVFTFLCVWLPLNGCPLIFWLWWSGLGLTFLWDCGNWRDGSWQATTPRALNRQWTEAHPLVSLWRRPLFPGAADWDVRVRCGIHLVAYGAVLKELSWHLGSLLCLAPSYQYLPEKNFYIWLEPQFLWLPSSTHHHSVWLWWPVWLTLVIPLDCVFWHTIKSCCLRVWLLIGLNPGAGIFSLGALTGRGISSPTGSY